MNNEQQPQRKRRHGHRNPKAQAAQGGIPARELQPLNPNGKNEQPRKTSSAKPPHPRLNPPSQPHTQPNLQPRHQPPVMLSGIHPDAHCTEALELLKNLLDEILPLSHQHRQSLGRTVRSLWEDLTSEKEHRASEYLSAPANYSAYVRYFLPWNILRLSSILPSLPLSLEDGATIIDIGSGPLTLPIALYIARPDLRARRLTIHCVDRTERILKLGQTIFESLAVRLSGGSLPPWKIVTSRQQFGAHVEEKADLVTAANVFNEFFWKSKAPLGMRSLLTARQLMGYLKDTGAVFLMEPGDPRSGSFIAALRAALASFGSQPLAPCPHQRSCPMPGIFRTLESPDFDDSGSPAPRSRLDHSPPGKGGHIVREGYGDRASLGGRPDQLALPDVVMPKRRGDKYPWCHFSIGTDAAPAWLKALTDEAGLSKDKLVFSFLYSAIPDPHELVSGALRQPDSLRVISEEFPLPNRMAGRYSCSAEGYSLVRYNPVSTKLRSGDLVRLPASHGAVRQARKDREIDEKSGAIIVSC
jgi:hypothetical protein